MKRLLTCTLFALLACVGFSHATGYHFRQRVVVAPVIAPVYAQPLAIAACGHAYTAPLVAPAIEVPQIAPITGTTAVTQSYAVTGATAQVVAQPVVQAYAAPAVVQAVTAPSYTAPLAVVGNAYSHVGAFRTAPVLAVRQRLAVVNHGRAAVVVGNQVAVRARVGGVLTPVGRFLFGGRFVTGDGQVIRRGGVFPTVGRFLFGRSNVQAVRVRVR